jgi:hypothetical protein
MTHHRLTTFAILTALCLSASAMAEEERPRRMMDLLKPGMKVGVQHSQRSDGVHLSVFLEEEYAIAQDAMKMGQAELREKYELVEDRYQAAVKKFREIIGEDLPTGVAVLQSPGRLIYTGRDHNWLASVEFVGEDYVLIVSDDENSTRWSLPYHSISSIRLDVPSVEFRVIDRRR